MKFQTVLVLLMFLGISAAAEACVIIPDSTPATPRELLEKSFTRSAFIFTGEFRRARLIRGRDIEAEFRILTLFKGAYGGTHLRVWTPGGVISCGSWEWLWEVKPGTLWLVHGIMGSNGLLMTQARILEVVDPEELDFLKAKKNMKK